MVAAIGAVAAVGGAAISASGAKSAANAQSASSDQATQAQMMASAQMQAALSPWVKSGEAAQNRLNQYLGLGGAGSSGVTSMGLQTGLTPDQVRQQLMGRFTRQSTTGAGGASAPAYRTGAEAVAALGAQGAHDYFQRLNTQGSDADMSPLWGGQPKGSVLVPQGGNSADGVHGDTYGMPATAQSGPASDVDYEGLDAAIAKYYEEQNAQNAAAQADPNYGSLLRAYRNGQEFSFTGKDLASDPGYQFGLNQGTQGIERGQAARGNFLSGAAMKELDRFNQDYAGTKFNEGFNRASSTWNTNRSAYDTNRNTIYSFLTGQSTMGQNSAAQVGTNNQQTANAIGNNLMGAGNAQAAGQVASSNALASGINGAVNSYNSTNNLNSAAGWNNLLSNPRSPVAKYPDSSVMARILPSDCMYPAATRPAAHISPRSPAGSSSLVTGSTILTVTPGRGGPFVVSRSCTAASWGVTVALA